MKILFFVVALCFVVVYSQEKTQEKCPDVETVDLDLQKYSGAWYEVAVSPFAKYVLQPGCYCTGANYTKNNEPNMLNSISRCNLLSKNGLAVKFTGTLLQPFSGHKGRLLMSIFPGIYANYWVLDTDYNTYAVVWSCFPFGMSNRKEVWILSRSSTMDNETYDKIIAKNKDKLEKAGFDVKTLLKEDNEGCKYK